MSVKDNILDIARRNFLSKGLRQTSMDEIAEQAGISKRTLYENFESKELLITEVICQTFLRYVADMETQIEDLRRQGYNSVDRLLHIYIVSQKNSEQFNDVIFEELRKYYPNLNIQTFKGLQDRFNKLFENLYLACKSDGFIQDDINTNLIFHLIKDILDDKLHYISSGQYTRADIKAYLIRPLIRSIGTPKGRRAFIKAASAYDDPYSKQVLNTLFI